MVLTSLRQMERSWPQEFKWAPVEEYNSVVTYSPIAPCTRRSKCQPSRRKRTRNALEAVQPGLGPSNFTFETSRRESPLRTVPVAYSSRPSSNYEVNPDEIFAIAMAFGVTPDRPEAGARSWTYTAGSG